MINRWLQVVRRDPSDFSFAVIDLHEVDGSKPSAIEFASLLREAYWGEEYLSGLANKYGWQAVRDRFLQARRGTRLTVKRGDFGEALTAQYLQEVEGYSVPVCKLRYKMVSNQTLPGTDCVAIKIVDSRLVEVCYVESKLRRSLDLSVAVAGATQLKKDAETALPEILTFIARRSSESGDAMSQYIEQYIFSRDAGLDYFKLMLFHERDLWDERILTNLKDEELELKPLEVYVVKIEDITKLSDRAFELLGTVEVNDDDD